MHELYDINISGSNVESALGYNQSNADDLLRQIYEKLPSSEAVVVWNVRRGALAAVLDLVKTALAIQDLKNTLDTLPLAVVAEVMGIEVPGLSLAKVDDLKNMAYGAVAALQEPPRVLAAFGQKIGDTVEEEGIAYSISYVAADVAIQVLLSKGLSEVKNVSKADELADVARTVDTLDDTVKIADELTDAAKVVDQVGDIADAAMAVNAVNEANAAVKAVDEVNDVADAVKTVEKLDGVIESGTDTVTYRRVQGGAGNQSSQQRVVIDSEGNVYINKKDRNLNISIDNGEHSQYYINNRPGADIYEFEVPKWLDDMVKEYTIPQAGYKSNPLNQGGSAPKLTDPTTPGTCIEVPAPWIEWIEEYATKGRIIS